MEWRLLLLELSTSSSLTLPLHRALEVMLVFRLDIYMLMNERGSPRPGRSIVYVWEREAGEGGGWVGRASRRFVYVALEQLGAMTGNTSSTSRVGKERESEHSS